MSENATSIEMYRQYYDSRTCIETVLTLDLEWYLCVPTTNMTLPFHWNFKYYESISRKQEVHFSLGDNIRRSTAYADKEKSNTELKYSTAKRGMICPFG